MIETPADILAHYADLDAVESFISYRKKHKRAALTERGAIMIAKTLSAINADGGDATEALDLAQEHGWQTIKTEWYWSIKNGNRNSTTSTSSVTDAEARQIAFAAGARRTPDPNCF